MKCIYKYPVRWIIKVDGVRQFTHNGWHFDFIQEDDCITNIVITVTVEASDKMPAIIPNPNLSGVIDFQINEPVSSGALMKTLRTLEGFLSVYGLESIALDEVDISWVAETEEEKAALEEQSFRFRFLKHKKSNFRIPFVLVERSVVAAGKTSEWEIPLSFFRKGRNDFQERKYIDAINDFYFLLETLFGSGKTKNHQVLDEFKKSKALVNFTKQILAEAEQFISSSGRRMSVLNEFKKNFAQMTPEGYLEHVIGLRGFLHHHSLQYKKIWSPTLEYEYELEAILLSNLCFKICADKVESLICKPSTANQPS